MVQSYILHRIKSNFARVECRGKAFQTIICLHSFPRATLRLPPVTYIGKPMCIAFQASLGCPPDLSGEPYHSHGSFEIIWKKLTWIKF